MATISSQSPNERSTVRFTVTLTDDAGDLIMPNDDLTWTLQDMKGNVVNNRTSVALASASTVVIILHGADLALDDSLYFGTMRVLKFTCTYDNSAGNGLEFADELYFTITDLKSVSS